MEIKVVWDLKWKSFEIECFVSHKHTWIRVLQIFPLDQFILFDPKILLDNQSGTLSVIVLPTNISCYTNANQKETVRFLTTLGTCTSFCPVRLPLPDSGHADKIQPVYFCNYTLLSPANKSTVWKVYPRSVLYWLVCIFCTRMEYMYTAQNI